MQPTSGLVDQYSINPRNTAFETRFFSETAKISSLEVGTNIISTGAIDTNPIHSPQVTINQPNAFKIAPIHIGIPKITIDEFGHQKIGSTEIDITEVDVAQARAAQVNRLEVNPTQVTSVQNDASKVSLPILITPEQFWSGSNFGVAIFDTAIRHSGITKNSPFVDFNISQVGTTQVGISQVSTTQISISQVSTAQVGTSQINTIQISPSEIGIAQVGVNQKSLGQLSFLQTGISQVTIHQTTVLDVNSAQIDIAQVDTNQPRWCDKESSQINFPKISFPSSISLQQLRLCYPHLYTSH